MQKTLSVRIDKEGYEFVKKLAKDNKEEVSKAIRSLVDKGRVMYAIDGYKKGRLSLGKAAEFSGLSVSEMMDTFEEFGVESKVSVDDYLKGLKNLRKHW